LALGNGFGSISLSAEGNVGINPELARHGITIRYRDGGETIRINAEGRTRKLKKLLQEEGVVPWMRSELPLLYAGDQLVAVADLWLQADCSSCPGLQVNWTDRPALK
jgi:tRNA(Ile)-lysidine synthase